MGAVDAWVVSDGDQFALWLSAVACPGGHEFCTKGYIGAFGTKGVVVGGKVGSAYSPDLWVVKPTNEFLNPVQGRHGIIVSEQDEVVIHLVQGEVARIRPIPRRVLNPSCTVLFAHGFGVIFGLGVRNHNLEVRVGLFP
jgi:hypothetical protein